MTVTAFIGLGSNLEDPARQLIRAIAQLRRLPATRLMAVSPFYSNPALPVPGRTDKQPDFINAVACIQTVLSAKSLLRQLLAMEARQGRQRLYRWGPRSLDLDLLLYGQQRLQTPELTLPHPELWRRAFVLYPLHSIAPYLMIPGYGSVKTLIRRLNE